MALIEITVGGNAPQHTLQHLQAALEQTADGVTSSLPGTTSHIVISHPAATPHNSVVEVDVGGKLPDQNQPTSQTPLGK